MRDEFVSMSESIFHAIETIFAQGVRRPGYPANASDRVALVPTRDGRLPRRRGETARSAR